MLGTIPIIPDLEGRRVLVTGSHRPLCVFHIFKTFSSHQLPLIQCYATLSDLSRGLCWHWQGLCPGLRQKWLQGGHSRAQEGALGCRRKCIHPLSACCAWPQLHACRHVEALHSQRSIYSMSVPLFTAQNAVRMPSKHCFEALHCVQATQMKHAVAVVADLSGGDAEMHRVIQETIAGLGGLDIIVNKCAAHFTSCLARKDTCSSQQHMGAVSCSGGVYPERLKTHTGV